MINDEISKFISKNSRHSMYEKDYVSNQLRFDTYCTKSTMYSFSYFIFKDTASSRLKERKFEVLKTFLIVYITGVKILISLIIFFLPR